MSEGSTLKDRSSKSNEESAEKTPDVPLVYHFRLTSPLIYLISTLIYILLGVIWYSPRNLLSTPLLGQVIQFNIDNPVFLSGFIWFAIITHTIQCFEVMYICGQRNLTFSASVAYLFQTLYCGGLGKGAIKQDKPSRKLS